MKTRLKRLLSGILALAMVMAMMPTMSMTAFAKTPADDGLRCPKADGRACKFSFDDSDDDSCQWRCSTHGGWYNFSHTDDCTVAFTCPYCGWRWNASEHSCDDFEMDLDEHYGHCTRCSDSVEGPHTYGANDKCTVCGMDRHYHTWSDWEGFPDVHMHSCTTEDCYAEEWIAHDFKNGDGICTVCNYKCSHNWDDMDGVCKICKIACDHDWPEDWSSLGSSIHYHTCRICSKDETGDHEWNRTTSQCSKCGQTCTHSYGYFDEAVYTCQLCGYVDESKKPAPYIDRHWDDTKKKVVDESKSVENYIPVTSGMTALGAANQTTWYVVNDNVTIGSRITVNGVVNLILADGKTLTASKGITVASKNTLNIYGQSGDSGKLIANGYTNAAGIGGNKGNGGKVTINGGTVTATGGPYAAGIGGGNSGNGGDVTINGGTVTATGEREGAGIGGGLDGAGGTVTINGGTVTANGWYDGAGIGGGNSGNGGDVTINGGTVTANGGNEGAGIGGGCEGDGGKVTINGGTVTANGGSWGAGIGGGDRGIGGGDRGNGGEVTINGGTVEATGKDGGAGIGGGCDGEAGTLKLGNGVVLGYGAGQNNITGFFIGDGTAVSVADMNGAAYAVTPYTAPAPTHEADTTTYGKDANNHWFTCAVQGCTEHTYEKTAHDFSQGDCVCGQKKVAPELKSEVISFRGDTRASSDHFTLIAGQSAGNVGWEVFDFETGKIVIRALEPNLMIQKIDAVIGAYYYGSVTFSSGTMEEQTELSAGDIVHVSGINANELVVSCTGYALLKEFTIYYTEEEPAPTHEADTSTYDKDANNHWFTCTVEGCTEHTYNVTAHTFENGVCVCGLSYTYAENVQKLGDNMTVTIGENKFFFDDANADENVNYLGLYRQIDEDALDFDYYKWDKDGKTLAEEAEAEMAEANENSGVAHDLTITTIHGIPVATYLNDNDEGCTSITAIFDGGDYFAELVFFYNGEIEKAQAQEIINSVVGYFTVSCNGEIAGKYAYGETCILSASSKQDWTVNGVKMATTSKYTFTVLQRTEVISTAAENEAMPITIVATQPRVTSGTKQTMSFTNQWTVPAKYTVVETGLIYRYGNANTKHTVAQQEFLLENYGVTKIYTSTAHNGTYKLNLSLSKSSYGNREIYAKSFITVTDGNKTWTIYSDMIAVNAYE